MAVAEDVEVISISHLLTPSKFKMACFPHFIGSAAAFLGMSELLLPTVEVLAFQYPHWDGSPAPSHIARTEALVAGCFEALADHTDRPLALFGHRSGAYLAYRVAQRLERETGRVPCTLFVSSQSAPQPCRTVPAEPPLSCDVVALMSGSDPRISPADMGGWALCTGGRFDLEVFPGARGFLDSDRRQVVNLIHDQLISLPGMPD
ncbi:thioesterase domain-containing protein [Streptomyces orinoci]|uniref:Thioesterase domain-containing protein n=1 Tax=Streptomyces orinoci TaxID=67339 RepID=A0ABV3K6V5_STRON|nr:thioesterase domain-containing protein [Streptomyces orinoci]